MTDAMFRFVGLESDVTLTFNAEYHSLGECAVPNVDVT